MSQSIKYVGPQPDGVTLAPAAGGFHFPPGVPVDVPDGLARSLLRQPAFVRASPPPRRAKGSAADTAADVETR